MKKCYINGVGCVSAQDTQGQVFLEDAVVNRTDRFLQVQVPNYKDYISPVALRRMAKGVKNSIVASFLALKETGVDNPDAIIIGTGMGCVEDSERFLKSVLDNNELLLTPTSFIQSIHNTVGTQIALGLKCKSYNLTYVNNVVSFETALLDAKMLIEEGETFSVLVGGVDEMIDYNRELFIYAGLIKSSEDLTTPLVQSTTKGVVYGEGATFFVLENEANNNTYAEVVDVTFVNQLKVGEVPAKIEAFLASNGLSVGDVDAVVLGYNGDVETDVFYKNLSAGLLKEIPQLHYKHLCGEYNTASAFGLWIGANVLKHQLIPDVLKVNDLAARSLKRVLLYNQYQGMGHSFVLIESV